MRWRQVGFDSLGTDAGKLEFALQLRNGPKRGGVATKSRDTQEAATAPDCTDVRSDRIDLVGTARHESHCITSGCAVTRRIKNERVDSTGFCALKGTGGGPAGADLHEPFRLALGVVLAIRPQSSPHRTRPGRGRPRSRTAGDPDR